MSENLRIVTATLLGRGHPGSRQSHGDGTGEVRLADYPLASHITGNIRRLTISTAQRRPILNYRSRLGARGLARFEVLGRNGDRDLIRSLARRLAEDTPQAAELRATLTTSLTEPPKKGGILAALQRSPLAGTDLDLTRPREQGRKVML